MKIFDIIKEVISPTQQFEELIQDIIQQGGEFIGSGDYGKVFLLNGKVVKVTTDADEIQDAQKIKQKKTKYFVHIFDVDVRDPKLAIITMEDLEEFTGDEDQVPIDDIYDEAEALDIYPDLEGPGGSVRMQNIMQDKRGNIKVIDV
jgi:hypothetical protein